MVSEEMSFENVDDAYADDGWQTTPIEPSALVS